MGEFGGVRVRNVSTELKLFDQSWIINIKNYKPPHYLRPKQSRADQLLARRIRGFSMYSRKDVEEEMCLGVLTKLKLRYLYPCDFKKVLTISDCNNLCRLMVPKEVVEEHIFKYWHEDTVQVAKNPNGLWVKVWDCDTKTEHRMRFKRWKSNLSYVFGQNWKPDFVKRRKLRGGDVIGMFWDSRDFRFGFRVLAKSN